MRISRPAVRTIRTTAATTASEPHGGPRATRRIGGGFFAFFLVLVLAVGIVPAAPSQAFGAVTKSGIDGGCTWTYDEFNHVLTIEPTPGGNGRLSEYDATPQRGWLACADLAQSIDVKDGVTAAGNMRELFSGMVVVTSVVLPLGFDQGITNAQSMFSGCQVLKQLTFPKGFGDLITNAEKMFSDCSVLNSVSLPDDFGGATMQADNMFDGSPLLSIVYIGENCNGSVLAQVPDATRNEYRDTWVRITDPSATYDDGLPPSALPADYESASKNVSTYARQHARGFKMKAPKTTAAVTTDSIQIIIGDPVPPDALGSYTIDGMSWQEESLFRGLEIFSAHDRIKARFSSAAYDTDAESDPLSATTRGLITYDANGGSGTTKSTEGDPDKKSAPAAACTFAAPAAGALETCTFKEWNASPDGKGDSYRPGDSVAFAEGGNTLYAVWEVHPIPRITTADLPAAMRGEAYSQKLSATADVPVTWAIESGSVLPVGISLAPDGTLSGTPGAGGSFTFTVEARNVYGGVDTAEFTLVVLDAPGITTDSLPDAVAGEPYSQKLSATGYPESFEWSLEAGSSLPEGLTLASDGTLSGKTEVLGTATFTVKVSNGIAPDAAKELSLTVRAATPVNTDGLAATGDAAAGPATGLAVLVLACSASLVVLALRRRAAKR